MPKKSKKPKFILKKRGFSQMLVLLAFVSFISLVSVATIVSTKKISSASQNVLSALASCSSGGLTTSVHKNFQMAYINEDFIQINNIDLLEDVSQLKDLTCLQYMDATDRAIKGDIANLKNLTNLEVFSLYSNPEVTGDICSLAGATKLRSLKFAFNPKITGDISCLKNLTKLETFAMTHTQISGDFSVFTNMPNLKAIYVNGTKISGNISSLSKLTSLEELGISDNAGNPRITGDLASLDNLKNLKKVSIYNTGTTNCKRFTKMHPNIKEGGCSNESQATMIDKNQNYERKIGKEVQDEGYNNYKKDAFSDFSWVSRENDEKSEESNKGGNLLTNLFDSLKNLISHLPLVGNITGGKEKLQNGIVPGGVGPGGCKFQSECETFCSKPENKETCSKFAVPDDLKGQGPRQVGPGGCNSETECQAFCSKPENQQECSKFAPPDGEK